MIGLGVQSAHMHVVGVDEFVYKCRAAAAAGMTSYTPSVQPASSQHHAEDDLLDRDIRAGAAQSVAVEAPRQHIAPVHSPHYRKAVQ